MTLLEANARKAAFLERVAAGFPNVEVVRGRAEEQEVDAYGVAVARALAPPPVAAEWCLPLVWPSGGAVLYVGPTADLEAVARVAAKVGGGDARARRRRDRHPQGRADTARLPATAWNGPQAPSLVASAASEDN